MRILFDLFFIIFGLICLPYMLVKGKFHRGFTQKAGFLPDNIRKMKSPVWIHAVSVGEAVIAAKVAAEIKRVIPASRVVVSTTTKTGNDMIKKISGKSVDGVFYYPMDIRAVVKKTVNIVAPRAYVMVETEIWPNLLTELSSRGIPVIMANGRISDGSFVNYRRVRCLIRRMLRSVDVFCMQTGIDAERIRQLGAPEDRTYVTGSIKFDEEVLDPERCPFKKKALGFSDDVKIIVAGSTHFPEETELIGIFAGLRTGPWKLGLVIAPRHIERVDAVEVYLRKYSFRYARLSALMNGEVSAKDDMDVVIVDTIGHLKDLYGIASLAFIGGSLAEKGGQNPMEAARWGSPVLFGPNMHNFREVADIFLENDAAVRVKDSQGLKEAMEALLDDDARRRKIEKNAVSVIKENAGAVDRTLEKILSVMKEKDVV